MEKKLQTLIDRAKLLNLDNVDVNIAQEFLENREYGLCLDTIVVQLYEYEINIDLDTLRLIEYLIERMSIPKQKYSYIKDIHP